VPVEPVLSPSESWPVAVVGVVAVAALAVAVGLVADAGFWAAICWSHRSKVLLPVAAEMEDMKEAFLLV